MENNKHNDIDHVLDKYESLFDSSKKINYYKILTFSHNTLTFLLTHKKEVQNVIKTNKKILKQLFFDNRQ